jgi:hypothetical protein
MVFGTCAVRHLGHQFFPKKLMQLRPLLAVRFTMYFEETMSREYLRGLVQMKKRAEHERHLGELVKGVMQKIGAAAATGATCYLYEMQSLVDVEARMNLIANQNFQNAQNSLRCMPSHWQNSLTGMPHHCKQLSLPPSLAPLPITMDDIVNALKLKCPGCDVAHQESWVDTAPGTRVLKSGIYISWE